MAPTAAALLTWTLLASLVSSSLAIQVNWSGQTWNVRSTTGGLEGPGPNVFSDSTNNVAVDSAGTLRLQVVKSGKQFTCAEIILPYSLGYGTYQWTVTSDAGSLDPNVVLGLFTYDDNADQAHREIDIEFARWGYAADPSNAQWVIQPYGNTDHLQRWTAPSTSSGPLVVSFKWTPGQIYWTGSQNGNQISSKNYTASDVPTPGNEVVHINLWLNQPGSGLSSGKSATAFLSDFSFTPA